MIASYEDANRYLDETKLRYANNDEAAKEGIGVDAEIRAALADIFGTTVSIWEDNTTSPAIIVEIAAMKMAASKYEKSYSEETLGDNDYSARLRKRADALILGLRQGTISLSDTPEVSSTYVWSEDDFWPNDTYVFEDTLEPDRKFTMDQVF